MSRLPAMRVVSVEAGLDVRWTHVEGVFEYTVFRAEPGGGMTQLDVPEVLTQSREWHVIDTTPGSKYCLQYVQPDGVEPKLWAFAPAKPKTTVLFGHITGLGTEPLEDAAKYVSVVLARKVSTSVHMLGVSSILPANSTVFLAGGPLRVKADDDGFWQVELLVGLEVTVKVGGASRTVVIPDSPTPVNLLDLMSLTGYPHGPRG